MKIDAQNYEPMRAWFGRLARETTPAQSRTTENDPVKCLDQIAERWPAKARSGLAMAIGDMIEATEGWPRDRVAAIDNELVSEGLPSLTAMRLQFSKAISRVVRRGSIKNEAEYYAIRNAAELRRTTNSRFGSFSPSMSSGSRTNVSFGSKQSLAPRHSN